MYRRFLHRIVVSGLMILGLIAVGTLGYSWIEGWSTSDGAYMSVITLSTVGYGEPTNLSGAGRLFTACLIFGCMIGMSYWTASLTSFVVENDLTGTFIKARTRRMLRKLEGHTIICGSGRIGFVVCERLIEQGRQVVLVGDNAEELSIVRERIPLCHVLEQPCADEYSLAEANLVTASAVVAATDSDVDNLLIGITCKDMAHSVFVAAVCNDVAIANRMRKAGFDDVICPNQIIGGAIVDGLPEAAVGAEVACEAVSDLK